MIVLTKAPVDGVRKKEWICLQVNDGLSIGRKPRDWSLQFGWKHPVIREADLEKSKTATEMGPPEEHSQ